jgi:hypothetical protein
LLLATCNFFIKISPLTFPVKGHVSIQKDKTAVTYCGFEVIRIVIKKPVAEMGSQDRQERNDRVILFDQNDLSRLPINF